GHALRPVATDVSGDLTATRGVADVDSVLQVQGFDQRREIVGVGVKIVAVPRLTRAAVTAAVVRDAAVAARDQEEHLVFKRLRAQWPAVAEHDWLTGSPVIVVELRPVLRRERAHPFPPFRCRKLRSLARGAGGELTRARTGRGRK